MEGLSKSGFAKEAYTNNEREESRERNFPRIIASHLLEHVSDDFSDAGFGEEDIKSLEKYFADLTEDQKRCALSIPAQLRVRMYEKYLERVKSGELTLSDVWADLLEKNERYKYSLGYHLSAKKISPDADGNWVIKGTEPDHRNDDVPMAYYSLDYKNRYREKPTKFLYVVRAELRDQSGHYRDNDGVWGRAPSLSVIDRFDLPQIEQEMDQLMKEQEVNAQKENT